MSLPNFFLAGAPKCGTTAMSVYLGGHPSIFFCKPKEPCFWSDDMPGIRQFHGINSQSQYIDLFRDQQPTHCVIAEGSTNYLVSDVAIENIMRFNQDAKFLLMARNPVDLVQSLHHHNHFSGWDDDSDLSSAWAKQEARSTDADHPSACLNPVMLQYRRVASLGHQIEKLFTIVPKEQRMVLLFDDFHESPIDAYRKVLDFLNVPDDDRQDFPLVNQAMAPRLKWLTHLLRSEMGRRLSRTAKTVLKGPFYRFAETAKQKAATKPQSKSELDPEFRQQLVNEFRSDVGLLSELIKRDLSAWQR